MPYYRCPACGSLSHSVAVYSTAGVCATCAAELPGGGVTALACLEKPWFMEKRVGWKSEAIVFQAEVRPLRPEAV